jgi:hypothetical protein
MAKQEDNETDCWSDKKTVISKIIGQLRLQWDRKIAGMLVNRKVEDSCRNTVSQICKRTVEYAE